MNRDYRWDRFKQRRLAVVVTHDEYPAFVLEVSQLWPFTDAEREYFSDKPEPMKADRHPCTFYRSNDGTLIWFCAAIEDAPVSIPVTAYALLSQAAPGAAGDAQAVVCGADE